MLTEEYLKDNGIISVKIITEGTNVPAISIYWVNGDKTRLNALRDSTVEQLINEEVRLRNIRFRKLKIEKITNNLNGIQN